MYPQFFGFDKLPFRLRPDSEFLYAGTEYSRARAKVLADLKGRARLILLTGPAGAGKTLLLDDVLGEIQSRYTLCRINQPHISATELLQALLLQLGAASIDPAAGAAQLFAALSAAIGSIGAPDRAPLLVVDDAQLLAAGTLNAFAEMLRREPRLRLLLAGRSGEQPRWEESAARIAAPGTPSQVQLHPLSAEHVRTYIERRLAVAGAGGKELFTPDAYSMVFQQTAGAPRLINVLCDAALHAACTRAAGQVGSTEILMATQDPRWPEAVARDKAGSNAAVPRSGGPAEAASAVPAARLMVALGSQHIGAVPLNAGRISIGRAADNELRLDARFISRHHCQVVTVGDVSTIEDLDSVNGMLVNGKAVKRHVLQHEDQVTLGEHVLTYLVS
ncbi:MAG: FHA domain-containing protein [Casimicrobiaceae bacterium]